MRPQTRNREKIACTLADAVSLSLIEGMVVNLWKERCRTALGHSPRNREPERTFTPLGRPAGHTNAGVAGAPLDGGPAS